MKDDFSKISKLKVRTFEKSDPNAVCFEHLMKWLDNLREAYSKDYE